MYNEVCGNAARSWGVLENLCVKNNLVRLLLTVSYGKAGCITCSPIILLWSSSDYMTLCTTPLKYAVDGMYHDVGWGRVQCWGRRQPKAAGTTRHERVEQV